MSNDTPKVSRKAAAACDDQESETRASKPPRFKLAVPPSAAQEDSHHHHAESCSTAQQLDILGDESAHAIPNPASLRSRSCALSESEISVLDLGPSVTDTPQPPRLATAPGQDADARLVSALANSQQGQVDGHEVRIDDLESVAVTSDSMSFSNEHPLHLRSRRHDDIRLAMTPRDHQPLGYGYGYAGYERGAVYFVDEPDCEVRPLSVPHSPPSPRPMRPMVHRSKSSFGGMDPDFLEMQHALSLQGETREHGPDQEVGGS